MRIYITKMQTVAGFEEYYHKAHDLLSLLEKHGHELVYIADDEFLDFDYKGIYKAIETCDALLAFTDGYTLSSTWRCSEITFVQYGEGTNYKTDKTDFQVIPIFLYRGIDDHFTPFIRGLLTQPGVFDLPVDTGAAADMITNFGKLVAANPYFYAVKKAIDKHDPYGLWAALCPADEYDCESRDIAALISKDSSKQEIMDACVAVFSKAFNHPFKSEKFAGVAQDIKTGLDTNK